MRVTLLFLALTGCGGLAEVQAEERSIAPTPSVAAAPDPFVALLSAPWALADGFVSPAPAPWRPCGVGCFEAKTEAVALAPASGRVTLAEPGVVELTHHLFENHVRKVVTTRLEGLTHGLTVGQDLQKGAPLGKGRRLTVVLVGSDEDPALYFASRPRLPDPSVEPLLALIHHDEQELRVYHDGVELLRAEVGFGQSTGAKERRGDNRTPKGVYRVVQRSKGPFDGPVAEYYGGHWMRLNYPNPWDAARGVDAGLITVAQQREITQRYWAGQATNERTSLGGGIGLHGWAYEWSDTDSRQMSWGCVVLHLSDVAQIYEALPDGAMVILF
ncbi:L,D-transpeptidase [Myxococcota bacterium]|nr:L,D-transpeptidase [Myxococcota bacterium]